MSEDPKKVFVLALSGGVDSATVLGHALQRFAEHTIIPVFFDYGSKHNQYEKSAAQAIAEHYREMNPGRVEKLREIELTGFMSSFKSALLLSGDDIPEGHYNDESMSDTVVPARNLIFMSILSGIAASQTTGKAHAAIGVGIHQGDHHIYADCRPEFFNAASQAVLRATDGVVIASAPLLHLTKASVVEEALRLDVPLELTRTCYKDQEEPCGHCGACVERLEAFKLNHTTDPVRYAGETQRNLHNECPTTNLHQSRRL